MLIAGDPERISRAERLEKGIPLDQNTLDGLITAAEQIGLAREAALALLG